MLRLTENILLDAWLSIAIVPVTLVSAMCFVGKVINVVVDFVHREKK